MRDHQQGNLQCSLRIAVRRCFGKGHSAILCWSEPFAAPGVHWTEFRLVVESETILALPFPFGLEPCYHYFEVKQMFDHDKFVICWVSF